MIPFLENKKGFLVYGFLVSKNVLCFQRIFCTYYKTSISCFLIDMKFVSKVLEIFVWRSYDLPIILFTKLFYGSLGTRIQIILWKTNYSDFPKIWCPWHTLFRKFSFFVSLRFAKIICSRIFPYFLVFVKAFW